MTNSTSSGNPLGYVGIDFNQNPTFISADRAPTSQDLYVNGTRWEDGSASPKKIYTTTGAGNWVSDNLTLSTDATFASALDTTASSSLAIKTYVDAAVELTSVTLTTAQVLALATTPIELVAAPGAGNYIEFLGAQFILDYNSIAYTEAGDNLGIKYTDAAGVQVSSTIETTGFIDQIADTITSAIPAQDAIVAAAAAVNQALVLDNLGSNVAAGNSPLIVKISYRVLASGL